MSLLNAESTAFRAALEVVRAVEPRVADAIGAELTDQRASLKLIASENYASPAVLLAMGNWLSDKYAEGTVGRRFYAGCRNVDTVEALAAEHARELFGAAHAYVQPHSGIDANLVAYWAILADRVEAPALKRAQARQLNDLTEADWFELRRELENMRSLSLARKLPRWLPMRDALVKRRTRKVFRQPQTSPSVPPAVLATPSSESFVVESAAEPERLKTGTD